MLNMLVRYGAASSLQYRIIVTIIAAYVIVKISTLSNEIADVASYHASHLGRWSARERTASAASIGVGLFALLAILLLAWVDLRIVSYSLYVLLPDRALQFVAGIAITALGMMLGHFAGETIGLTVSVLLMRLAPRPRALVFLACAGAVVVLLLAEFTVAYRRGIALSNQGSAEGITVVNQAAPTTPPATVSPQAIAAGETSGLIAVAIGLGGVLSGLALNPALQSIVSVVDVALRAAAACASPILYLLSLMLRFIGAILRFPADVVDQLQRFLHAGTRLFNPLLTRITALGREPRARGRRTYPEEVRLGRIAEQLMIVTEDQPRKQLEQEYNAIIERAATRERERSIRERMDRESPTQTGA